MPNSNDYPAVILGGGHNGLVCGAYLAKAGVKCLILEARDEVGGCSATVSALGTKVNVCNCDHILFRSTNIAEELELETYGLEYLEVDPVNLALFWEDAHAQTHLKTHPWFLHRDLEATIAELGTHYSDQIEGYRKYCETALPVVELIVEMATQIPTLAKSIRQTSRLKALRTLLKWQKLSALEVLEEFFSHPALITPAIGLGPAVWGVDIAAKGTGLGALSYAMRHSIGIGRPQGGSGALTDALRKVFESYGGKIVCSSKVAEIIVDNKSVRALKLEAGEEIMANQIIAAFDPRVVVSMIRGAGIWDAKPQFDGYESKIDAVVSSLPTYKNMPTNKDTPTNNLEPTAIITPSIQKIREGYLASTKGQVPEYPIMLANFPTVRDPAMSSENIFSLEVLNTPYALIGGWENSKEPERWLGLYDNLVEEDFLDQIKDWRCMTPVDYETDFGLARGYAPSFSGSPISAVTRNVFGKKDELTRYASQIKGLFFTGAGTYPGAGIWGASGKNAAQAVLKTLG